MSDQLHKQGEQHRQNGQAPRTDLPSNSQAQDRYMDGYGKKSS